MPAQTYLFTNIMFILNKNSIKVVVFVVTTCVRVWFILMPEQSMHEECKSRIEQSQALVARLTG